MNINKFYIVAIGFTISSFVLVQNEKEILIQEAIVKRVNDYKLELLDKCKNKAKLEAEVMVDSIIAIELGAGPIDTLEFPRKPNKPSFESYDSLKQNQVKLKPLFEESSLKTDTNKKEDKY